MGFFFFTHFVYLKILYWTVVYSFPLWSWLGLDFSSVLHYRLRIPPAMGATTLWFEVTTGLSSVFLASSSAFSCFCMCLPCRGLSLQVHAPPATVDLFPGARLVVRARRVLGSSDAASVLSSHILPRICGRSWAVDFFPTPPGVVADLYFVSVQGLDRRKFSASPLVAESFCSIPGGRHNSHSSSYSLKLLLPMGEDWGEVPRFHACLWTQPISSLPPVFPVNFPGWKPLEKSLMWV